MSTSSQANICVSTGEEYDGLTCLLSGGIEEGEDEREALQREIAEETGYTDITIAAQLGEQIESHYIKKGGERFVKNISPYLVTLHSHQADETAKEADEKFENLFKTPDEIREMMTLYERTGSSLADHKEIYAVAVNTCSSCRSRLVFVQ